MVERPSLPSLFRKKKEAVKEESNAQEAISKIDEQIESINEREKISTNKMNALVQAECRYKA